MDDIPHMHRCLELAELGRGSVGVNPLVGAVLVRNASILAEGFHAAFGAPHAESALLASVKSVEPDDVLYVNLEPCCHRTKKTPPCADLLMERGVRRVVIGMIDPNPAVSGKGIDRLRNAGIEVTVGVERARCEWLNRGYSGLQMAGRPWITLKRAQTRDRRHANADGSFLKITNAEQDAWSHTWLRATHDAILVGRGTIERDHPRLTARLSNKKFDQNYPLRIALDPELCLTADARIFSSELAAGTIVICGPEAAARATVLEERGVRVFPVARAPSGAFDWNDLWRALTTSVAGFPGIASLLVEGGPTTWRNFREAGMVDAEAVLIGR